MKTIVSLVFAFTTGVAALACAHAATSGADDVAALPAAARVNLNTASERDLIALPGIGPAKAAAILAYREKHGRFRRVDDLRRVKGFGRKTVAKLRPSLTVDPPPDPPPGSEARKEGAPPPHDP